MKGKELKPCSDCNHLPVCSEGLKTALEVIGDIYPHYEPEETRTESLLKQIREYIEAEKDWNFHVNEYVKVKGLLAKLDTLETEE